MRPELALVCGLFVGGCTHREPPVESPAICVTAGRLRTTPGGPSVVESAGLRGWFTESDGRSAELAFTYRGPSRTDAPLASGELRRQIGLKLRAQDTCNVVYVMWHLEPTSGIFVSLKRNPGASEHAACGARGYVNVRKQTGAAAPVVRIGEPHRLLAELRGAWLRVVADDVVAWEGLLPEEALAIDGPAGLRADNGDFVVTARVSRSAAPQSGWPTCSRGEKAGE